jgi:hypothetical protein
MRKVVPPRLRKANLEMEAAKKEAKQPVPSVEKRPAIPRDQCHRCGQKGHWAYEGLCKETPQAYTRTPGGSDTKNWRSTTLPPPPPPPPTVKDGDNESFFSHSDYIDSTLFGIAVK